MDDDELNRMLGQATRHTASERLRAAVRTQVALHAAHRSSARDDTTPPAGRASLGRRIAIWMAAHRAWVAGGVGGAGGLVAGALLTFMLLAIAPAWQAGATLPADVVSSHTRVLASGSLFDVASSDRHNVKPWFQGRLDFAPQVFDLAGEGFALRGGRIDHLQGRAVAALVYAHRLHVVQVYEWPDDSREPVQALQQRGYNLLHWSDGAMQVWVVSDADAGELRGFAGLWQSAAMAR